VALAPSLQDEALQTIVARAYGGGRRQDYLAFNAVFEGVMQASLGMLVGGDDEPMLALVDGAFRLVEAEGPDAVLKIVAALFLDLSGNRDLRLWVEGRCPEVLALVPQADFLAAERGGQAERVAVISSVLDGIRERGLSQKIGQLARDDLGLVDQNLRRLGFAKRVHDILHTVQTSSYAELGPLLASDTALTFETVSKIRMHVWSLKLALGQLEEHLAAAVDVDRAWVEDFKEAIGQIEKGQADPEALREGLFTLRGILRMQLIAYDQQIVAAADRIPFNDVLKFLQDNAKLEIFSSPTALQALDAASHELVNLDLVLRQTLALHRYWQGVDAELWLLERELEASEPSRAMLKAHWSTLSRALDTLRRTAPDMWDANMDSARLYVDESLAAAAPGAAVSALRTFVRIGRLQFFGVDKAVLDQCNRISALRRPIEELLKET
jgi:hypothetical protein